MVNRPRVDTAKIVDLVEFGTVEIPSNLIVQKLQVQNAPAIRQGPEGQRGDQQGMVKMKFSDFTGGLFKRVGDWTRDGNRYSYNVGLMTHIPGGLYIPYKLTTVTTQAVDISGYRALNRRVHSLNTSIGTTAVRYFVGVGPYLFVDTSASDPVLSLFYTLTTDIVLSIAEITKNNTLYLAIGTNGATEDVRGWADPIDVPGTHVALVALSAGDSVWGMATLPQFGKNVYYGKIGGATGLFYDNYSDAVGTAPKRIVSTAGANVPNPNNTAESQTKSCTLVSIDSSAGFDTWTSPDSIKSSDDSRASNDATNATGDSFYLVAQAFGFNIPTGSIFQGAILSIEGLRTGGAGTAPKPYAKLWLGAAAIGDQKTGTAFGAADAVQTLGGANDNWGYRTGFDASDINDPSFGVRIHVDDFSGAGPGTAQIDHVTLQVYYLPPGSGGVGASGAGSGGALGLPLGGYSVGLMPSNKDRWVLVCPVADEETSVNQPRQLIYVDLTYDSDGDRLTASLSYPHTGLTYVESACFFAGGVAVAGDLSSTVAKAGKLVDSNGIVRDLGYLGQDGYATAVGISSMVGAGRVLIVDSTEEDDSDSQHWYYFDGTWHASTPLQTISGAIGGKPLGWAESSININQQYRYRVFPHAGSLKTARSFQPRNLFEDPITNNTTVEKQGTNLHLDTPELNLGGPEEAQKVLLAMDYLGQLASADVGNYGTLGLYVTTYKASGAIVNDTSNIFDSAFETFNVASNGVAFTTAKIKVQLTNQAASDNTPNGVPFLLTMSVLWPPLYTYEIYIDWEELNGRHSHLTNFLSAIETLVATKSVQRFRWGAVDVPVVFEGMEVRIVPPPYGSPPQELTGKPVLVFRQVRGTTT